MSGRRQRTSSKPSLDWDTIRAEYEGRLYSPTVICQRHKITTMQLRYRREQENWATVRGQLPNKMLLIGRMLRLLAQQMAQLEKASTMPIEKRTKLLAEQVKTLDKLIELGAAARNVPPPSRRDMTDLRAKLIKRLDQADGT